MGASTSAAAARWLVWAAAIGLLPGATLHGAETADSAVAESVRCESARRAAVWDLTADDWSR